MLGNAPPAAFEATFLHSGRSIHHAVDARTLTWFDPEQPDDRFTHDYAGVELAPGLWLFDFRKVVEGLRRRTFLVLDTGAGRAFDATFLEEGPSHWRFDRGTVDAPLAVDTPFTFPRRDVSALTTGERARGFALSDALTLVTAEQADEPLLAVWATDERPPRAVHVAPPGL